MNKSFQMSADSNNKILEILIASETVADKISMAKQEIVALDKRRQETRQALRSIEPADIDDSVWITIGTMLVKMKRKNAIDLMKKDQQQIEFEINKLRSDQKIWVNELRDLEHQPQLKGFDLKPLSTTEVRAFQSNLPSFI